MTSLAPLDLSVYFENDSVSLRTLPDAAGALVPERQRTLNYLNVNLTDLYTFPAGENVEWSKDVAETHRTSLTDNTGRGVSLYPW